MMKSCRVVVAIMFINGCSQSACLAMNLKSTLIGDKEVGLVASGPIMAGDSTRLSALIDRLPHHMRIVGISLDSPGGVINEAIKLAQVIQSKQLSTYVEDGHHCFSACFLLFAAGKHRWASGGAYIGVHSAALVTGQETLLTLGETGLMARVLSEFGVSDEIIGKMITTRPGAISSLTSADMAAMGVGALTQSPFPPFNALVAIPDCILLTNRSGALPAIGLNIYPCRTDVFAGSSTDLIARRLTTTLHADMAILDFQSRGTVQLFPADQLRAIRRHLNVRLALWVVPTVDGPLERLLRGIALQFNDWLAAETLNNTTMQVLPKELEEGPTTLKLAAPTKNSRNH